MWPVQVASDFYNPFDAPNILDLYIFTISVCPLGSSGHMIYTLSGFYLCIMTIEPIKAKKPIFALPRFANFAQIRENYEKVGIFKRLVFLWNLTNFGETGI